MPKLLIFAPCDRVIVSAQDNTTSIISLIEAFNIEIPEDAALPEGISIPIKWHVLSIWEKMDGEENKKFEQLINIVMPKNGGIISTPAETIDFEPNPKRFRMVTMVAGFPVSPAGELLLKVSVREVGQDAWQEAGEYAIFITRPAPQNTETASEESRDEQAARIVQAVSGTDQESSGGSEERS